MIDLGPYQEALGDFARRWSVEEVALFGSALRDDFGASSDIDLLLTFGPGAAWSLLDRVSIKLELEDIFGRSVDVTTRSAVERSPNWIRRASILDSARTIHAAH